MLCDLVKDKKEIVDYVAIGYAFTNNYNKEIVDSFNKLDNAIDPDVKFIHLEDLHHYYSVAANLIRTNQHLKFIKYFCNNYVLLVDALSNKKAKNYNLKDEYFKFKQAIELIKADVSDLEEIKWRIY